MSNTNYNFQIQRILLAIDECAKSTEKVGLLKEAIAIADRNNDIEWSFDLRLNLISEEKNLSSCTNSFHAFATVIDIYENNPELFNDEEFLWEYKWMIASALRTPLIPFAQIEQMVLDYKRRLNRHGFSFRAGYLLFLDYLVRMGTHKELAYRLKEKVGKEGKDDQSNCDACELDSLVDFELRFGDIDIAISKAQPVLTKQKTCAVVPLVTNTALARTLADRNKQAEAEKYLKQAEEELLEQDDDTYIVHAISDMIYAYANTNQARGLELFAKYADAAAVAEPEKELGFAKDMLHFLSKLPQSEIELSLSSDLAFYETSGVYSVEKLTNHFAQRTDYWTQQFDQRLANNALEHCIETVLNLT